MQRAYKCREVDASMCVVGCVVCEMGDRESCNQMLGHEPVLHFAELLF